MNHAGVLFSPRPITRCSMRLGYLGGGRRKFHVRDEIGDIGAESLCERVSATQSTGRAKMPQVAAVRRYRQVSFPGILEKGSVLVRCFHAD